MTDKEQIMIDGVDIIDCDYFYVEQETDQVKCDNYSGYCREHKNCPFKQLARKTQECEELSNKIKNEIQNTVEMERLAKSYGQDLMIYKQNKDIEVNSLKDDVIFYLKLIKKIEIYCDEQNLKYDTTACEILDIISGFADGRSKASPDSEQIEHTVTEAQMRNSVSMEQIQDNKAKDCQ